MHHKLINQSNLQSNELPEPNRAISGPLRPQPELKVQLLHLRTTDTTRSPMMITGSVAWTLDKQGQLPRPIVTPTLISPHDPWPGSVAHERWRGEGELFRICRGLLELGPVLPMDVHVAAEGLSVGEAPLAEYALVGSRCGGRHLDRDLIFTAGLCSLFGARSVDLHRSFSVVRAQRSRVSMKLKMMGASSRTGEQIEHVFYIKEVLTTAIAGCAKD